MTRSQSRPIKIVRRRHAAGGVWLAALLAGVSFSAAAADRPLADPPVVAAAGAPGGSTPAGPSEAPASFPAPRASGADDDAWASEDGDAGDAKRTFFDMLQYGWEINAVIGILGFLGLFLFFHFWLTTRTPQVAPAWIPDQVAAAMVIGKPEAAVEIVERDSSLLAGLAVAGLRQAGRSRERIDAALETAGRRVLGRLRQRVNYLAHIGMLTPMLGLLGTVMGLMKAFNVLGAERMAEGSRALLLGSAIGEAMITTAVGLMVGIPAMALYFICLGRLGRAGDSLEAAAERLSESLAGPLKNDLGPGA